MCVCVCVSVCDSRSASVCVCVCVCVRADCCEATQGQMWGLGARHTGRDPGSREGAKGKTHRDRPREQGRGQGRAM